MEEVMTPASSTLDMGVTSGPIVIAEESITLNKAENSTKPVEKNILENNQEQNIPKPVEKNILENKENSTKPKRILLKVLNSNNNNTDKSKVLDNETGDSSSSTSSESDTSDGESGSEESGESEEKENDEEKTRNELEIFIDRMESNPKYKLVEYRGWRLYELTRRDIKLFDKINLYDFAVNKDSNILLSLGQIVQIKRRKRGVNWAIISLGNIEISGRNRMAAILRKEETTEIIAVPICDLIPDHRKIEIPAQQTEHLLAEYETNITHPTTKSSPRVRKRTQTNYFTPNSPNKRLKSLTNFPQPSTPKSTPIIIPNTIPKSTPRSSPKVLNAVVIDHSSHSESALGYSLCGITSNPGATASIPLEIDDRNSNSYPSYKLPDKVSDSNSNSAVKSEERVPVSSGSPRQFSEGNDLDLALSVQPGISSSSNFPRLQQSSNSYGLPHSGSLQHCEMYLFNNQQQFQNIQQFQFQQQTQQQQHLQQQEYFKQQQLRQIQLQNQCEAQFDLQRQAQRQFEAQQQFQFQIFQQQQQQHQQQRLLNELMLSNR